jgi:8-oxo-dGTP pyrophosphatase MutT (NUDIX family)
MTSVGPCNYVVVVLPVKGSKALDIKLVLQREPRNGKKWFRAGSILPNEEHVGVAVRELLQETDLTLRHDYLIMLNNNAVLVSLREGKNQLVYVFSAYVPVPYVEANIRTHTKLVQAVTVQLTINHDGIYVDPKTIDIDGLLLTPTKTGRLLK